MTGPTVYATENGKTPFSIYQGRWSVLSRDFERDIIPMARHFGMALAPWGALGGGRFQSAKQLKERKEKLRGGAELAEHEVRMSEALSKVAAEHGIESVTAVALAYVMHKAPYVYIPSKILPLDSFDATPLLQALLSDKCSWTDFSHTQIGAFSPLSAVERSNS